MRIAITLGDVNGVGPDILLRTWRLGRLPEGAVVVGDVAALEGCAVALGIDAGVRTIRRFDQWTPGPLCVLDAGLLSRTDIQPGVLSAAVGAAALAYLNTAVEAALAGQVDAIVTLPVNKEAIRLSQPAFAGHTGVLAERCGVREYVMTLVTDELVVPHVSAHVSLREAIDTLSTERITTVVRLSAELLRRLGRRGRIAVLGLNPHAGEAGAFGTEEQDVIAPAIAQAQAEGLEVSGPVPPDTAFMRALRGDFDAVVCMYHDQGHIPMKTVGMERAVNVTVGLPIVRTSVDHGTAFDIAWQGTALTGSFECACELACVLARVS